MATFRVAFEGEWQEDFDNLADAEEWAREVSATGRISWVVERRMLYSRLRATFPAGRREEAEKAWRARVSGMSYI